MTSLVLWVACGILTKKYVNPHIATCTFATMESDVDTLVDHLESGTQPRIEQWHPKLTPYRFLVISTTIGLGIAKAFAVGQNLTIVATYIEWITGVAVFSMLSLTYTSTRH